MPEDNFEYIEAYLAEELSDERRSEFEQKLKTDADFAAEFALQKDTHQLLSLGKQIAYKEKLQLLDKEIRTPSRPFWVGWQVAAAAVVLFCSAVALWFWQPDRDPFQSAFSPYPDRLSMRQAPDKGLEQEGITAYNKGDFELAAKAFEQLSEEENASSAYLFYWGVALMGTGEYGRADSVFSTFPTNSLYFLPAEWYHALALGKLERKAEAQAILQNIARQEAHPYQASADKLLEAISKE